LLKAEVEDLKRQMKRQDAKYLKASTDLSTRQSFLVKQKSEQIKLLSEQLL
jgi:hypothetical protein